MMVGDISSEDVNKTDCRTKKLDDRRRERKLVEQGGQGAVPARVDGTEYCQGEDGTK